MTENLLEKINAAMDALGSRARWKKAPDEINDKLLRESSVLIIDDDRQILENILPSLIVNMADARFIHFQDQTTGNVISQVIELNPDVVLMDYHLGKNTNGAFLTKQLRDRGYAGCIIGFSSAEENNSKFMAAGANGCIEKKTYEIEKDVLPEIAWILTTSRKPK